MRLAEWVLSTEFDFNDHKSRELVDVVPITGLISSIGAELGAMYRYHCGLELLFDASKTQFSVCRLSQQS